ALTTNLTNEVSRATAAEGTLTTNLTNEASRAMAAENTLTTNLAGEVSRAEASEAGLMKTWVSAPATSTSTGTPGEIAQDGTYLYICTATNTWKRVALSTW
ncbi:MAG TPA: hypothetical protein VFD13_08340, partial [Candidatus Kapabacteria bacterium]|nr:hypothetical protein [Candidatus Kapabacteria bacterium]